MKGQHQIHIKMDMHIINSRMQMLYKYLNEVQSCGNTCWSWLAYIAKLIKIYLL